MIIHSKLSASTHTFFFILSPVQRIIWIFFARNSICYSNVNIYVGCRWMKTRSPLFLHGFQITKKRPRLRLLFCWQKNKTMRKNTLILRRIYFLHLRSLLQQKFCFIVEKKLCDCMKYIRKKNSNLSCSVERTIKNVFDNCWKRGVALAFTLWSNLGRCGIVSFVAIYRRYKIII